MSTKVAYDFPATSLEDWMKVVRKDLKDKSYEGLTWVVDGDIALEPVNHGQGLSSRGHVLSRQQHHWKTVMAVASDYNNEMILKALENGVDTLAIDAFDNGSVYESLFRNVEPGFLTWVVTIRAPQQLTVFQNWVGLRQLAITFRIVDNQHNELLTIALSKFPESKYVIGSTFETGKYSDNLCGQIVAVDRFLRAATRGNLASVENLINRACLETEVSSDFLVELANLRAMHLIWKNYLKAFELPAKDAEILVGFDQGCLTADRNTNLIQLTTMVMSSVVGGASIIHAGVVDKSISVVDYETLRLSANIQMILKMECYFAKVADPYAGSYFVENLTQKLALKAWNLFKSKLDA